MAKNLFIYTLLLVVANLFLDVMICLTPLAASFLSFAIGIMRIVYLFVLFPLIGIIISAFFKKHKWHNTLIATSIIMYVLMPLPFFFMTANLSYKDLLQTYILLHANFGAFAIVYLPYILASILCIWVSYKLKLF